MDQSIFGPLLDRATKRIEDIITATAQPYPPQWKIYT